MTIAIREKTLAAVIVLFGLVAAIAVVQAQTSARVNASVRLEQDKSSGLFKLTITDPDGIQEFSLQPPQKGSYGGGVKCPTKFESSNVFFGLEDFEPKMDAIITDCKGNVATLELPPLKDGISQSIVTKPVPPPPPPPAPTPTPGAVPTPAPTPPPPAAPTGPVKIEKPKSSVLANIPFPVKELGDCQSEVECLTYCDDTAHGEECLAFAKKHNLLQSDDVKKIEKLVTIKDGPGGCNSQKSCEAYCNSVSRLDECIAFGEKHGFLTGKELGEAKKIRDATKLGFKLPGNCGNKKECEAYCNNLANAEECLTFAQQSGFMDPRELELYRKFIELGRKGGTPGGCSSREACELYCQNTDNIETCLNFGEKIGAISKEELQMARKMMPLIKEGKTPGKCRSKEQCEAYCQDDAHIDECISFGIQAGMVSEKEAEILKKTGGRGPGGCKGKERCETYCQDNQEMCMKWAQENGMIREEELSRMRDGLKQFQEEVKKFPPEMSRCLEDAIGKENFAKMQGGQPVFDSDLEKKMQACFQIMGRDLGVEIGPGGSFKGPGGCTSQEECMAYCQASEFKDPACLKMMQGFGGGPGGVPPGGGHPGGFPGGPPGGFPGGPPGGFESGLPGAAEGGPVEFKGPGGCVTFEECYLYCKAPGHEEECNKWKSPEPPSRPQATGAGGCRTVEECREYCHVNQGKCEGFVSEGVPSEVKCQEGFEIARDNRDMKYCAKISCTDGHQFITDQFGRRTCSPLGGPPQFQEPKGFPYTPPGELPGEFPRIPPGGFPGAPGGGFPGIPPGTPGVPPGGFPGAPGSGFPIIPPSGFPGTPPPSFEIPTIPQTPTIPPPPSSSDTLQTICPLFAVTPSCDVAGPVGSENYNLCKKCYPAK